MSKKKSLKDCNRIFMQKGAHTFELCGFDRMEGRADFTVDLGDLDIDNTDAEYGVPVKDFVKKLKRVIKKLESHKYDVFVVQ